MKQTRRRVREEQSSSLQSYVQQLDTIYNKPIDSFMTNVNMIFDFLYQMYGKRMNAVSKPLTGVIFSTTMLIIAGMINTYSMQVAMPGTNNFIKQAGILCIGTILSVAYYYLCDYRKLLGMRVITGANIAVFFGLIFVLIKGQVINGARRWIHLGFFSLQPSEFAKLTAILWTAALIVWYVRDKRKVFISDFVQSKRFFSIPFPVPVILFFPLLLAAITYLQPDFGTAALIAGFPLFLVVFAMDDIRYMRYVIPLIIVPIIAVAIFEPYRLERILVFLNPWKDASGAGYQITQSIISLGSGQLIGYGRTWNHLFTSGLSKFAFLPEAHTDFAFAVWSQEQGFVGCVAVMVALAIFMYSGFCIGKQSKDLFGALCAYGMTMLIGMQGIYNMLMVAGATPVVGVPLPFVSYGGSALLMNIFAVALLANIARITRREKNAAIKRAEGRPLMREEVDSKFRPVR